MRLKRTQWKLIDWIPLENDFGEKLILTEVSPGLLMVLLRQAVLRSMDRVAAQESVLEAPRLCYDVLKRELH
eukprot:2839531-Pyramimonas_sp.AAC.1